MGSPLRMKIGPSRVFNTYGPIFTRDTKAQSRTKSAITMAYTFALLRVFVPLWLFSIRLLVMRRAWSALRNVPKRTGRVDYVSDPKAPGLDRRWFWRRHAESCGQIE